MIKHIVMWKLKEQAEGKCAEENAQIIKRDLEALSNCIQGIIKIEVGIDYLKSAQSYDLVLYSEFESQEALDAYQIHEAHVKVAEFIGKVRLERVVVDYNV